MAKKVKFLKRLLLQVDVGAQGLRHLEMGEPTASRETQAAAHDRHRRRAEEEELALKSQLCGLLASAAFLLGSILLILTVPLIKVLACFLLALQLIPEICIDSFQLQPRGLSHGRYARAERPESWQVLLNKTQSAVFLTGCVLQCAAFGVAVQLNQQPALLRGYQVFNLAAAVAWVLSGLVVILNRRLHWPTNGSTFVDRADWVGSALYVVGCLGWLAAAIRQFDSNTDVATSGYQLQRLAAGLWSLTSLMHLSSDVWRLCHRDGKLPSGRHGPPPPARNETESSIGQDSKV